MEPDISDQYDTVDAYIASRLVMMSQAEEMDRAEAAQKRQVNVRIPQHAYDKLVEVAGDVGHSPSGLAADLLELAIYEAAGVNLTPHNANSAGTPSDG